MTILPTGTITFLFTDIVGSTARWEQQPDVMAEALQQHDWMLRAAIEAQGGHVFKTVGDAVCAAFTTSGAAVAAALAAQRARQLAPWPAGCELPVRMALHAGSAVERDDDYFGPTLNRVARLLTAAHGGQIVASQTAYELARDELPADVVVQDLGEHRLRDLVRAEHVYQLGTSDVPHSFPPLNSLHAHSPQC